MMDKQEIHACVMEHDGKTGQIKETRKSSENESTMVSVSRGERDNGRYSLHKWDLFVECTPDIRLTSSPVPLARIVRLLKDRHGKCVFHNGSKVSDAQREDYRALVGLGYEILWGTSELYDALLRYKATSKGSRELGFLVFDYKPLLDNPDKNAQINLVLGRYVTMVIGTEGNRHVHEEVYHIEDFLDPEFVRFHDLAFERRDALRILDSSDYARRRREEGIPFTDPTARWLWEYVMVVAFLAAKYRDIADNLKVYAISCLCLIQYIWCRWCFKNHFKLRYKAFVDLMHSKLLEMILKGKGI